MSAQFTTMGRGDYWDAAAAQNEREAERRAAFIERESELRPMDMSCIVEGLRNLSETEERQIAAALIAKDQAEAGRLIDIATQRWITESIEGDALSLFA